VLQERLVEARVDTSNFSTQGKTQESVLELVKIIQQLEEEKHAAAEDLEIYHEAVAQGERASNASQGARTKIQAEQVEELKNTKWITCRGKGADVPKYLQCAGRVKNRHLPCEKVSKIISELWAFRKSNDATMSLSMDDLLLKFMVKNYGTERMLYDMSYNLLFAANCYSADADCEMFLHILEGTLAIDACEGQLQAIAAFKRALEAADRKQHGGREWKALDRKDFMQVPSSWHRFPAYFGIVMHV
jgi:hypothetical protein